MNKKFLKKKLE